MFLLYAMQIHPATVEFLRAIKEHNSRKYFKSIKPLYDEIWQSILDMGSEVLLYLKKTDDHFGDDTIYNGYSGNTTIKDHVFRIYRDARRLQEGDLLYKENFGIVFAPGGRKSQLPAYYVHIEPDGQSLFCAGLYWPSSQQLMNLRQYILRYGAGYYKLVNNPLFAKTFGNVEGKIMDKLPRGLLPKDNSVRIKEPRHITYTSKRQQLSHLENSSGITTNHNKRGHEELSPPERTAELLAQNATKFQDILRRKQFLTYVHISDKSLLENDLSKRIIDNITIAKDWVDFLHAGCIFEKWHTY